MHYLTLVAVKVDKREPELETDAKIAEVVKELKQQINKSGDRSNKIIAELYLKRMEHLSNVFARCVDSVVADAMEPYCESTENPAYLEFAECCDDVEEKYNEIVEYMVKLPNGTYIFPFEHDFAMNYTVKDGKVYQKVAGPCKHEMRTKKAKKMTVVIRKMCKHYKSIKDFAEKYLGYRYNESTGKYGYYFNPNCFWDWYQIGGRWPCAFLVRTDCTEYSIGEGDSNKPFDAPDGYMWVAAARKKDIAWDVMYSWKHETRTKRFNELEAAFMTGELPESCKYSHITEDGIVSYGDIIYKKGESLEEYLARVGCGETQKYPFSPYAFLDENGWNTHIEYEYKNNKLQMVEKEFWINELNEFVDKLSDETVLVSVDNHN